MATTQMPVLKRMGIAFAYSLYFLIPASLLVSPFASGPASLLAIYGSAMGAVATLIHKSVKHGLVMTVVLAIAGFFAALASPSPVAGAIVMAVIAMAVGISSHYGLHYSSFLIPILVASIVIDPEQASAAASSTPVTDVQAGFGVGLAVAGLVLFGGLLAVAQSWLAMRVMHWQKQPPLPALSWQAALYYGCVGAICLGFSTWWILDYERAPDAAWLLVTLVLLLQPSPEMSIRKSIARVCGSLIGGLIAAVIAFAVTSMWLHSLLALLCLSVAVVFLFDKSTYWLWVTFWTPAIILFESTPQTTAAADEYRIAATLVAGAVVLAIALLSVFVRDKWFSAAAQGARAQ